MTQASAPALLTSGRTWTGIALQMLCILSSHTHILNRHVDSLSQPRYSWNLIRKPHVNIFLNSRATYTQLCVWARCTKSITQLQKITISNASILIYPNLHQHAAITSLKHFAPRLASYTHTLPQPHSARRKQRFKHDFRLSSSSSSSAPKHSLWVYIDYVGYVVCWAPLEWQSFE